MFRLSGNCLAAVHIGPEDLPPHFGSWEWGLAYQWCGETSLCKNTRHNIEILNFDFEGASYTGHSLYRSSEVPSWSLEDVLSESNDSL